MSQNNTWQYCVCQKQFLIKLQVLVTHSKTDTMSERIAFQHTLQSLKLHTRMSSPWITPTNFYQSHATVLRQTNSKTKPFKHQTILINLLLIYSNSINTREMVQMIFFIARKSNVVVKQNHYMISIHQSCQYLYQPSPTNKNNITELFNKNKCHLCTSRITLPYTPYTMCL
jgi:hypothetical protein